MSSCPYCGAPAPPGATFCGSCGQPLGAVAAPAKSSSGMKAIVIVAIAGGCLLLAIAVAGIVAAIFIPNFLDALQKAKQKRTVADMRTIAVALESYREQADDYPQASGASELGPMLAGHGYHGKMEDGWNRAFRFTCLSPGRSGCASYELDSGGRDGVFEHDPGAYDEGSFQPTAYDSDPVLSDGGFLRWPEGQGRMATGGSQ